MSAETVLSGALTFLSLADLLQLLGGNGSSGILRLRNEQNVEPGLIYFNNGNPVHAICPSKTGLEALYTLFGWVVGEFAFSREKFNVPQTIQQSRMEIILDGLRMLDDGEVRRIGSAAAVVSGKARSASTGMVRGPLVDYLSVVNEEHFATGSPIVHEGSYGNWIWVILEGQVDIFRQTADGPSKIMSLGEGAFIGSLSAFSIHGHIRSESCVAATKVVLGVLDFQRLATEYSRMSHAMRRVGVSLDQRLRHLNDLIVGDQLGPDLLKDLKPLTYGPKLPAEGLYLITEGRAVVVRDRDPQRIVLARLESGDVFGLIPFADIGHEPHAATVWVDDAIKLTRLDSAALESEFERLSTTFKNIFDNLVIAMSVTTRMAIQESQRNNSNSDKAGKDQRRHIRYDSLNLLHFSLPSGATPERQGMGRTLNVSQSGILLETQEAIPPGETIALTIGLEEDLVTIEGETVHCQPTADKRFTTGIHFRQMNDSTRTVLTRYIQLFEQH